MAELTEAQQELIRSIPERVPLERIQRIWIFPAHQGKSRETGLFVIGSRSDDEGAAGLQAVHTLRYQAETVKGKLSIEEQFVEEGWAPPDRIDRIIEGTLARAGDDLGEPDELEIQGEEEGWREILESYGALLDPESQE